MYKYLNKYMYSTRNSQTVQASSFVKYESFYESFQRLPELSLPFRGPYQMPMMYYAYS